MEPKHLQSLTSLRFVAALLVVVFHLSMFAPGLDPFGRLLAPGYVGVTFFFVLSGFVLTYSWDADDSARRFYRRRFARVYPTHLLFLGIAILPPGASQNWPALPANALLLQSWSPDDAVVRSFSGVAWSLSCELFFYATFPLLVRGGRWVHRPLAAIFVLVALAFGVGAALQARSSDWGLLLFHLPAFRIVEFACGSLAATALVRGWVPRLRVRWAAVMVVVSYLSVLVIPVAIGYRLEDRWALTLAMVPSVIMLIATCARSDLAGAPSPLHGQAAVRLGQWSFCIYMAHPVVIALMLPLVGSLSLPEAVFGCLLVVVAVVAVAWALHEGFERPLERWLREPGDRRASGDVAEVGHHRVGRALAPIVTTKLTATPDA